LAHSVPPPPQFGDPLPVKESQAVLDFLALRRSASAATLQTPGPSADELSTLLRLAARAPDHGKLAPWRFVILEGAAKQTFVEGLEKVAAGRPDGAKASAKLFKIKIPPVTVAVVSRAAEGGEIPVWEQQLSAGAVCTLLTLAAGAMGYGANWITDWYAYDEAAGRLLGLKAGERVAGFVHLGTASEPPQERVRPDMNAVVSRWAPQ
jgi:nitroreductase